MVNKGMILASFAFAFAFAFVFVYSHPPPPPYCGVWVGFLRKVGRADLAGGASVGACLVLGAFSKHALLHLRPSLGWRRSVLGM